MSWPLSPSNGQEVLINGMVYVYDSTNTVWNRLYATTSVGGGIITAVTVTQAGQPNITSVGVLSNVTSIGNIQGANLVGTHANGNSNVAIAANSNVTISVAGNTNIVTVTGTGVNVAGTLNVGTGNANVGNLSIVTDANIGGNLVLGGNLIVSGSTTTVNSTITRVVDPIVEQGGGANGAALSTNDNKDRGLLLHYYTTTPVDAFMGWDSSNAEFAFASNATVASEVTTFNTFGNIRVGNAVLGNLASATYFTGNGSLLTNLNGSNVTGQVANALVAGTVYTNAQPNITSVGTLVSVNVSGNITSGNNIIVTANISANNANLGNLVTANYFTGAGNLLSNIVGGNVTGQVANALIATTITANAQPNITSVGTLASLSVTGAITATAGGVKVGNIQDPSGTNTIALASGAVTMLGNLTIGTGGTGNFSSVNANLGNLARANYFTGTLTTAIQPNITSVGTLASLSVTANVTSGNADLGNLVTANYFTSNLGITANNMTVSGLFTSGETTEVVSASGAVSSSVTNYDLASGATFYHSSVTLGANWTVNIQNAPTTDARSIIITIVVVQGATPYIPSALQIGGSAQTIKWTNGTAPTGKASAVDIFSFGLIRTGATWAQVLGSYTTYS